MVCKTKILKIGFGHEVKMCWAWPLAVLAIASVITRIFFCFLDKFDLETQKNCFFLCFEINFGIFDFSFWDEMGWIFYFFVLFVCHHRGWFIKNWNWYGNFLEFDFALIIWRSRFFRKRFLIIFCFNFTQNWSKILNLNFSKIAKFKP